LLGTFYEVACMSLPRPLFTRGDYALIGLLALGLSLSFLGKADPAPQPEPPTITDSRTCAAVAVYELSTVDDWNLRATIARTTLNAQETSGVDPECGKGLASALSGPFKPILWQNSLDAVDAVASGSYELSDACARAKTIITLPSSGSGTSLSDDADRAQCVLYNLAFL
jgi:hypothetical protein